ncbi:spore germination protein [Paenibacillus sp. PL2-23]|uniref:spore germination protein n=1 Tax=Paenibacillus sp. PL2-23 TaxID=2100729 RepID=UPI0030FC573B
MGEQGQSLVDLFQELDAELHSGLLKRERLEEVFRRYTDFQFPMPPPYPGEMELTAVYCEGMIDKVQLNEYFVGLCQFVLQPSDADASLPFEMPLMQCGESMEEMLEGLLGGSLILYVAGETRFWMVHVAKVPQRSMQESNTEISIKGPRDAFTEELFTNISLVRKRLRTAHLYCEQFVAGSLTSTRIALLYLEHKADPTMVKEARSRLEKLQTEAVVSSGQLEQWIADKTFALFPLLDYIGRPDFIVETLLRGRFAIIVDGSPMVLIGPSNFLELLKTPEDVHYPYYHVAVQRFLRLIGMVISIALPGFWLAIASVNLDQIPFSLVSTVVISRNGVPLPMFLESLLLIFLFELLREAGVRLPKAVGQTIGIVGGLIIGDALIRAGLASPTLLVVIAISSVATYSLVNQSLIGSVSLFRTATLLASAYLGIYGFFLAMFGLLIYMCRLESFGLAYLEPIVSLQFRDWLAGIASNPFKRKEFTAEMIENKKEK